MDLLKNLPTKYEYSRKIKSSDYQQSVTAQSNQGPKKPVYSDIRHLFVTMTPPARF